MIYDMFVKAFIIGIAVAIGSASTLYFKMRNDNFVEQIAEEVIDHETGVTLDLSPDEIIVSSK